MNVTISSEEEECNENAEWDDWEVNDDDNQEESNYKTLFTNENLTSIQELFKKDEAHSHFHFLDFIHELNLDEYSIMQLINYIRKEIIENRDPSSSLLNQILKNKGFIDKTKYPWNNDIYLIPTLKNDNLLQIDFKALIEEKFGEISEIERLKQEIENLKQLNLIQQKEIEILKLKSTTTTTTEFKDILNFNNSEKDEIKDTQNNEIVDREYFNSYNHFSIHKEMILDEIRTETYKKAIEINKDKIKDKIIMDIGCGTGILSIMAYKVGAKKVIAIDASPWCTEMTQKLAKINKCELLFKNNKGIDIYNSKLEDLKNKEKVDVIISEWMGYALLFESMLNTVLYGRDNFLKEGGIMMPDKAEIYIAGVSESVFGLNRWKSMYDLNMEPMKDEIRSYYEKIIIIDQVKSEDIITSSCLIKSFDLMTMTHDDCNFTSEFELKNINNELYGIVLWFNIYFSNNDEVIAMFSTSPNEKLTHWKQAVMMLKEPMYIINDQDYIKGRISMSKGLNHRSLIISLELEIKCVNEIDKKCNSVQMMTYNMNVN